jgi:hypothetical protein
MESKDAAAPTALISHMIRILRLRLAKAGEPPL